MSEAKRFFVSEKIGETVRLTDGEFHHAADVLRVRPGNAAIVCNGDGFDYIGTVTATDKRSVTIAITSKAVNVCDPTVDVTLFQAVCKGERMELIAQKANELGVRKIVPFVSRFTNVKKDSNKPGRMEKIAAESAKQCGRSAPTEIAPIADFADVLRAVGDYDRIILAYEHAADGSLPDALELPAKKIALVVGSEGGFDPSETEALRNAGARVVTMGRRTLRAETAAIALISAVMCFSGEWVR